MSATEQENPIPGLLSAAEGTLGAALGGAVRLEPGEILDGRPHVMRCRVVTSLADAPETVIVKSAHNPRHSPYDPENLETAAVFFQDWLGIQFLDESHPEDTPAFSPRFYGGDRMLGYFLMEDLGAGESLATVLLGDNAERAEAGLLIYAATLGRMHAATVCQHERFGMLGTPLGIPVERLAKATQLFRLNREQWKSNCDALGILPAPGTNDEMGTVEAMLAAPGPFLAYTHGDPCPDNNRLTAEGMRLFDFEHGSFRHALLDGIYGRIPFPTCWCVSRLPTGLSEQMEAAYRKELATTCPEASDDARFYRESMTAWAGWLITTMQWGFSEALTQDNIWGISSIRQRLLFRCRLFADATVSGGYLPALGETVRRIGTRLEEMWGAETEPMPLYPAFR